MLTLSLLVPSSPSLCSSYLVQVWGKEGRLARSTSPPSDVPREQTGHMCNLRVGSGHCKATWLWLYITLLSAWDEPLLTHCRARACKGMATLLPAMHWWYLGKQLGLFQKPWSSLCFLLKRSSHGGLTSSCRLAVWSPMCQASPRTICATPRNKMVPPSAPSLCTDHKAQMNASGWTGSFWLSGAMRDQFPSSWLQ